MQIKKHRVFYNIAAEEKWLDSMGAKGYLLVGTAPFTYCFEKRGGELTYSGEWLDSSPYAAENEPYVKSRTGRETFCCGKGCRAYFASAGECAHSAKSVLLAKRRYKRTAIFWTVIAALMIGLLVYNVIWAGKFDEMEYAAKSGLFKNRNPAIAFMTFVLPLTAAALLAAFYCFVTYFNYKNYAFGLDTFPEPAEREGSAE